MDIAFSPQESARPNLINDVKIETAQLKYIKPVLGGLYEVLDDTQYEDFVTQYLKLPLAMFVKSLVIDDAAASIGSAGAVSHSPDYANALQHTQLVRLKKQTLNSANALMKKAVEHIAKNPDAFPEYDPEKNIQSLITCQGGIVM
jgi:hypothetical protein